MPDDTDTYEVTRDSVLYIVDASASMENAGALNVALSSASWAIREAAREGSTRVDAGVIIYNVAKVDSENSSKTSYVVSSLREPQIDEVKRSMRLSNNIDAFKAEFTPLPPSGESSISASRLANSEMNQLHTRSMRRVVLITNNDDPMKNDDSAKTMIVANLASDSTASPAFLMPIFLNTPRENEGDETNSDEFDIRKFWINLNYMPPPIASAATNNFTSPYADDMWTNQKLLEPWDIKTSANPRKAVILSKSRRRYIAFKGKISIGALSIGVRAYNIVHYHHRPSPSKIAHITNKQGQKFRELSITERTLAYSESGTEVSKDNKPDKHEQEEPVHEVRKFKLSSSVKNENDWTVPVSDKQSQALRHPIPPNGKESRYPTSFIHKFVPAESVKNEGCIGHSTFSVPSSDLFTQSWTAFASSHRTMRKRKIVAVTTFYPSSLANRSNTPETGYLFAFNPAHLDNAGYEQDSKHPDAPPPNTDCGMYFVPRPFNDDIRPHPISPLLPSEQRTEKNEDAWYDLTQNLKILFTKFALRSGYTPTRFPHPLAGQFAEILEHHALHLALEKDALERKDETRPRYDKIVKTSGLLLHKINESLNTSAPLAMPSIKAEADEQSAKRIKTEALTPMEIMEAFKLNRLDKFTVRQLRETISRYEAPQHKLKAQLVEQSEESVIKQKIM